MLTLSHGFKKPQDGDKGSVFFPALEDDIVQLNSHDHDGTDSELIVSTNISVVTQAILSAAWVATSNGLYRQLITVPNSKTYDAFFIVFKNTASKAQMYQDVEKVSSTTYYVYINDNSVALTAYYLS